VNGDDNKIKQIYLPLIFFIYSLYFDNIILNILL